MFSGFNGIPVNIISYQRPHSHINRIWGAPSGLLHYYGRKWKPSKNWLVCCQCRAKWRSENWNILIRVSLWYKLVMSQSSKFSIQLSLPQCVREGLKKKSVEFSTLCLTLPPPPRSKYVFSLFPASGPLLRGFLKKYFSKPSLISPSSGDCLALWLCWNTDLITSFNCLLRILMLHDF